MNGTPGNILFFGVKYGAGHHWYAPEWHPLPSRSWLSPQLRHHIDGVFCPDGEEVEGRYTVSHVHGFTVIAWWDRSADSRGKCNAALVSPGRWSAEGMLRAGREAFPELFERIGYDLVAAGEWALQPPSREHVDHMRRLTS